MRRENRDMQKILFKAASTTDNLILLRRGMESMMMRAIHSVFNAMSSLISYRNNCINLSGFGISIHKRMIQRHLNKRQPSN